MAKKKPVDTDVIVVGAGPAGTTAALTLARAGQHVTLVDSARFPRPRICAGWLGPRGVELLAELDIDLSALRPRKIAEALFLSSDLTKSAQPAGNGEFGVALDRAAFDNHLVKIAKKAGVRFIDRSPVKQLLPGESDIQVRLHDDTVLAGRFLIVATGISQNLLAGLGLGMPGDRPATLSAHVAATQTPNRPKKARTPRNRVLIAFNASPETGCAIALDTPESVSLTLHAQGDQREIARQLIEFARGLHTAGLVGIDLTGEAAIAKCMPSYPFNALEVDSHVGKRSIVIGDAGGFYAAISHEGIFPAIWSATIAAQAIADIGPDDHAQDVLTNFDRAWRLEMAEFLRPPNTDLQLLLPLIFTNQPMADRMGAAFFQGENI